MKKILSPLISIFIIGFILLINFSYLKSLNESEKKQLFMQEEIMHYTGINENPEIRIINDPASIPNELKNRVNFGDPMYYYKDSSIEVFTDKNNENIIGIVKILK